jgi:hypothetical protein
VTRASYPYLDARKHVPAERWTKDPVEGQVHLGLNRGPGSVPGPGRAEARPYRTLGKNSVGPSFTGQFSELTKDCDPSAGCVASESLR